MRGGAVGWLDRTACTPNSQYYILIPDGRLRIQPHYGQETWTLQSLGMVLKQVDVPIWQEKLTIPGQDRTRITMSTTIPQTARIRGTVQRGH